MWTLQSSETEQTAFTFRLRPGAIKTIGRATRADFIVKAPLVSRLHCRVEADEDTLLVVDLASTNGTFVNDARVEHAKVKSGDRLRVGRVIFQIGKSDDAD
jgi:pSer/pThr/pTyr-binding forkhead associated (FHA) protein